MARITSYCPPARCVGRNCSNDPGCPQGCLFDILADPTETTDLKATEPQVFAQVRASCAFELCALLPP